jgi:adenine-specific DNA-methyltransferase
MEDSDLEIHETPRSTPNFRTELAKQLAELVPEAIADGKIDVAKLKELLAEDVADETERFGLFWPGKKRALRAAQEPTTATLRPDKANSKDWDTTQNVFIEGDNLEVLKILQKHYHNKIKLIYIDPPYNTGKDFVYPDNFKEGLETYLEWTKQVNEEGKKVSTNSESEGRYHSNWLNMMYPRLKLARNLLKDDGVVFVSIDDNEQDNLLRLGKEVFGESNFIGQLAVQLNPRGRHLDKFIAKTHESILVFARNSSNPMTINGLDKEGKMLDEYDREDQRGKFRLLGLRNRNQAFNPTTRPKLYYPLYVSSVHGTVSLDKTAEFSEEVWPDAPDGVKTCWTWGKEKARDENALLIAEKSGDEWRVYRKDYLLSESGETAKTLTKSIWLDKEITNDHGRKAIKDLFGAPVMDFPKSPDLIARLINLGSRKDSIILDFFAGAATTAEAVLRANAEDHGERRFVMIQLPEPTPSDSEARKAGLPTIAAVARQRIKLSGLSLSQSLLGNRVDFGFRSFRLCDTSFTKWRASSDTDKNALEQHLFSLRESANDDATPDDLLIEILLKQGYSLTEKIVESQISDLDVRIVGDNMVIAYLTEAIKPTLEQLRALVEQDPQRIIVLEDAFQGDDELKTNLAQLCKSKGIELWTA